MTAAKAEWKTNEALAVGKGATLQQFIARVGRDELEIDVAPWGEGHLRINGREVAHVDDAKDRRQECRKLKQFADRFLEGEMLHSLKTGNSHTIPAVKAKLLEGKKGLIVGIANENS